MSGMSGALVLASLISEAAISMMKSLSSEGKGSDDHGGLIQWYENQAKVEVRS